MNETQNKTEYVERWDSHINDFNRLRFCNDTLLSDEVKIHMNALKVLVRKIADTKDVK